MSLYLRFPKATKTDIIRGFLDTWDPLRMREQAGYMFYNYEADVIAQTIVKFHFHFQHLHRGVVRATSLIFYTFIASTRYLAKANSKRQIQIILWIILTRADHAFIGDPVVFRVKSHLPQTPRFTPDSLSFVCLQPFQPLSLGF